MTAFVTFKQRRTCKESVMDARNRIGST